VVRFLRSGDVGFLPTDGVQARLKRRGIRHRHGRVNGPVLLGLKRLNFLLAFADDPQRDGLHAPGTQTTLDLLPQQRANFVAHQAIEEAARLLGRHFVLINATGLLQRFSDAFFGDFMQQNTVHVVWRGAVQFAGDMPGNRLSLPIWIRRQVDPLDLLGFSTQLLQELSLALNRHVFRRKIMSNINPETVFRQILNVPNGCLHRKASSEIFFDCFGFCG